MSNYESYMSDRMNENKCFCGGMKLAPNYMYCPSCLARRADRIKSLTPGIKLDSEQEHLLVQPYEILRVCLIEEKVGALLDDYVREHKEFPLTDTDFFISCISAKNIIHTNLLNLLDAYCEKNKGTYPGGTMGGFVVGAYLKYYHKLFALQNNDKEVIEKLNATNIDSRQNSVTRLVKEAQKRGN